jgi:hypothetical protein
LSEAEENQFYRELGRKIRAGIKPPELNRPIVCRECGPVWSMAPAALAGDSCFWCGNRLAGRVIPRPPVTPEMKKLMQDFGLVKTEGSNPVKQLGFEGSRYLQKRK